MRHHAKILDQVRLNLQLTEIIMGVEHIWNSLPPFDKMAFIAYANGPKQAFIDKIDDEASFHEMITTFKDKYHNPRFAKETQEMTMEYVALVLEALHVTFRSRPAVADPATILRDHFSERNIKYFMQHGNFLFGSFENISEELLLDISEAMEFYATDVFLERIVTRMERPNIFARILELELCTEEELYYYLDEELKEGHEYWISKK